MPSLDLGAVATDVTSSALSLRGVWAAAEATQLVIVKMQHEFQQMRDAIKELHALHLSTHAAIQSLVHPMGGLAFQQVAGSQIHAMPSAMLQPSLLNDDSVLGLPSIEEAQHQPFSFVEQLPLQHPVAEKSPFLFDELEDLKSMLVILRTCD